MHLSQILKELGEPYELVKELDGYANMNFIVQNPTGEQFILKYYDDLSLFMRVQAEDDVLSQMSQSDKVKELHLPYPKQGVKLLEKGFSRVLYFVHGNVLGRNMPSEKLLESFGKKTSQLMDLMLPVKNSFYQSSFHDWDLLHALLSREYIHNIDKGSKRKIVQYHLAQFEEFSLPALRKLPFQMIHGDLNEFNVLYEDEEVTGFIDFGDMSFGPRISEIAIALAYIMMLSDQPIRSAKAFLKGISSTINLSNEEVKILPNLIATRLCVSVLHAAKSLKEHPNSEYLQVSSQPAWNLLGRWHQWNPQYIINEFSSCFSLKFNNSKEYEKSITQRRTQHIGSALKLSYSTPIYMKSAAFQYMYDIHGNAFLDAYNNIPIVGHAHPNISDAIAKQSKSLYTNSRYLNDSYVNYAEELLQFFPDELDTIFFVNSGTEANELAYRIAKAHTKKNKRINLELSYHGHSNSCIDISSYKYSGPGGNGKPDNTLELPLVKKNNSSPDQSHSDHAINLINESINRHGHHYSSIIVEPISGCGGQVEFPKNYLKEIFGYCNEQNIVTISDEVQVGFGRLGRYFWGYEMHDVIPDIVVLGKPMGNGFPIGAVVTKKSIASSFDNGMEFFSSFGGNQLATEVGRAVLRTIRNEDLQNHATRLGDFLMDSFLQLQKEHPCIADVRGSGFFLGVEFQSDRNMDRSSVAKKVKEEFKANHILTSTDGRYNETLKIKGPLSFTMENAAYFVDVFDQILKKL